MVTYMSCLKRLQDLTGGKDHASEWFIQLNKQYLIITIYVYIDKNTTLTNIKNKPQISSELISELLTK